MPRPVMASSHDPELDRLTVLWSAQPTSRCFAPLAEALRKRGALEQATAVATAGIASRPEYLPGRLVMARIYIDQGQLESARDELEAALALDATHPVVIDTLEMLGGHGGEAQRPAVAVAIPDSPAPAPTPAPQAAPETATIDHAEAQVFEPEMEDEDPEIADAEPVLTESLAMLYRGQGHLTQAVDVLDALVARAPDNAQLIARRDAVRAELDVTRPRPYDAAQSGGRPVGDWLASVATSRATPPAPASSFDAFYQAPATPPSEAGDLAAFQAWLRELGH